MKYRLTIVYPNNFSEDVYDCETIEEVLNILRKNLMEDSKHFSTVSEKWHYKIETI